MDSTSAFHASGGALGAVAVASYAPRLAGPVLILVLMLAVPHERDYPDLLGMRVAELRAPAHAPAHRGYLATTSRLLALDLAGRNFTAVA